MNYLFFAFEVIATCTESAILIYIIIKLFQPKFERPVMIVGITISYLIISLVTIFLSCLLPYSAIFDLIFISMYIICALILFKGNIFYRALVPIISICIIVMINLCVNAFTSKIFEIPTDRLITLRNTFRVVNLFMTKFIFFIVAKFLVNKIKNREAALKLNEWICILSVFIISVIILLSASEMQYSQEDRNINIIVLVCGIAVINVITVIFVNKLVQKNKSETMLKIMEIHDKEQRKAFQSIEQMHRNIQILRHDMKNEWVVINQAIKSGDYAYAQSISEKMIGSKIKSFEDTITVSNPALNAFLNYKISTAAKSGINISSYIQDDFEAFEDYDIIMLLSNLLDNAIEASERIDEPIINITITTKANYLSIVVSNKIKESVLSKNPGLKSTKRDTAGHGLGTKSVKQICDKYDGMIDYYEKDDVFIADAMLKKTANQING